MSNRKEIRQEESRQTRKMRRKRRRRRIFILILVVILAVSLCNMILLAASTAAANDYWARTYDGISLNADWYADKAADLWEEYEEQADSINQATEYAQEIEESDAAYFAVYNEYIEMYFLNVYEIDVSERIDAVEVYWLDFTYGDNELVGGSQITGLCDGLLGSIYLSVEFQEDGIFSEDEEALPGTYVHEMIHAIGSLESEDDELVWLYEGFTEYLTQQVFIYNIGYFVQTSGYVENTMIAAQMAAADDTIISEMMSDPESFSLTEWVDARTDGYAQVLENMLFLSDYGGYKNQGILLRAQYIAAEYCKNVNEEQAQEIVSAEVIVNHFELRSILHGWK